MEKFAPQRWEGWLSTLTDAEREAAEERVAIMAVENNWPEWLARAEVMWVVRMATLP